VITPLALAAAFELMIPAGNIEMTARATAPSGWLIADGSQISRTQFAKLFQAIGTSYGVGNGSTTFNIPDMRGRVPVGRDAGQTEFDTLGKAGGAKTHTLTIAEMPAHNHQLPGSLVARGTGAVFRELAGVGVNNVSSLNTGGSAAHNNLQPYRVLNFIIKT
jgi:microcystin-dependent protein